MNKFHVLGLAAAVASIVLAISQVNAHHAFAAEFDADAPVLLKGKVTKVQLINPHSWIHLTHVNEDGSTEEWMVEGGTPNTLLRAGITKRSLPIGTPIIVRGYQSKDKVCEPKCKATGEISPWKMGKKSLWVPPVQVRHKMVPILPSNKI